MPNSRTRKENSDWFDLFPLGQEGLDYHTSKALVSSEALVVGENIRLDSLALQRRKGSQKVYRASNPCGSFVFGTDAKYATIPAATHLALPAGGHALMLHFTAVRPGAGNVGYILSSRVTGETYHAYVVTIDENGLVTVSWTANSDELPVAVTTTALTDDGVMHLLAVHDAPAGTFTVYVNGVANGTPVTAIATNEKIIATAGTTAWHFGVHYSPATASVIADTHFDGAIDGAVLMSLVGTRPSSGTNTLLASLLRHSFKQWPAPQHPGVRFCYDFDEASTTVLTDRSRHKNVASMTGTPTSSGEVALATIPTHLIRTVQTPNGQITNVVGSYGRLFYEIVKETN
jgi:hypothetical protein